MTDQPRAVALYARVSSTDQAERQTVDAQTTFLRNLCALYNWPIAGEYVDDGVSGTVPFANRPAGRRLLADVAKFDVVVVHRLDRLGRSLRVILDAHKTFEDHHVAFRSGTEPIDTATSVGRFVFSLLGSLAELERETMQERLSRGRDQVAKGGRWTGGPIPFRV